MDPATLISLPDASTTLTAAAGYATPLFGTLIGLVAVLIGIVIGGLFVAVLARTVLSAVKTAFRARGGGGRGRRRR